MVGRHAVYASLSPVAVAKSGPRHPIPAKAEAEDDLQNRLDVAPTTHSKVELSELSPTPDRAPYLSTSCLSISLSSPSPLINYLGPENGRPKWEVLERSCRGNGKPENTALLNESGKRPSPPPAATTFYISILMKYEVKTCFPTSQYNTYFPAWRRLASEHK